jgi:hypothetical protein
MSFKSIVLTLGLAILLALVVGCAKAPQQAVDAAKAAIEEAKGVEADRYVADVYASAQDSLNAALAEIETQNSKFALTRNYDKAAKCLASALKLAQSAKETAPGKKEEVKAEAEKLTADVTAALAEANKLLKKAPKGKEGREMLEAIKADIATVEASLPEAATTLTNGDFLAAKDKLNAALAKVNSIVEELNNAIAKKK